MQLVLRTGCEAFRGSAPNAKSTNSVLSQIVQGYAHINDSTFPVYIDILNGNQKDLDSETDAGAVLYIVVVLVFYSFGIIIMIVKYLRREQRELEEERILNDFFRSMPQYKKEREQTKMNKIAIQSFHALTSYSETLEDDGNSSDDDIIGKPTKSKTKTDPSPEQKLNGASVIPDLCRTNIGQENQRNLKESTVKIDTCSNKVIKDTEELETHL